MEPHQPTQEWSQPLTNDSGGRHQTDDLAPSPPKLNLPKIVDSDCKNCVQLLRRLHDFIWSGVIDTKSVGVSINLFLQSMEDFRDCNRALNY